VGLRHRKSGGEVAFDVANAALLVLLCALTLYPFLYVVSRSVMSESDRALRPFALVPREISTEGYDFIFAKGSLLYRGYLITFFRTIVGTILSVVTEAMFAYALSRRYYPVRRFLTVLIAVTMWFEAGLVPNFLVIRAVGLYNSVWVFVLPALASAWYIFIMRTFFAQIPDSLEESARMDGAQEFTILARIVAPLSKPVLATVGLFHVVYHWNEWFSGVVYVTDKAKVPVQVLLWQLLNQANSAATRMVDQDYVYVPPAITVQMAMIVITTFPIVVAYPFFQKYFVKGMLVGSIKG
jgi:putative aldouronate transport system permease protein